MTETPAPPPVTSLTELKAHLQLAVGLELTTIPPYLTALYSIKEGTNPAAVQAIRSVVMEEMLHMTLAANVLNAIGGSPSIKPVTSMLGTKPYSPVPTYPVDVGFITGLGVISLRPFSQDAIAGFMAIEHPTHGRAKVVGTTSAYGSIGQFYAAVSKALEDQEICPDALFAENAAKRANRQVAPGSYYGGAGELTEVRDRKSALAAVRRIVDEGEGLPKAAMRHKVVDDDHLMYGWLMYSHYARFKEIATGRHYRSDQIVQDEPLGAMVVTDWSAVHPARADAVTAEQPEQGAAIEFDLAYSELVDRLYTAFNGTADALKTAVTEMYDLKYRAVSLMRTPFPGDPAHTIAPGFRYVPAADRPKKRSDAANLRKKVSA